MRESVETRSPGGGAALVLVLIVLSALAMVGAPFVISMALQDRESLYFAAASEARRGAESARNHAIAHLERTVYAVEFEEEIAELTKELPPSLPRVSGTLSPAGEPEARRAARTPRSRRGSVVRRDLGEETRSARDARSRARAGREGAGEEARPEFVSRSLRGPSPREVDGPEEFSVPPLDRVPVSRPSGEAPAEAGEIRFRDPRGLMVEATVADEQGKIHLDTAPPRLLAALFGVGRLARPLAASDRSLLLEDASAFPGDSDPSTIDGAVVVDGTDTVVTYRRKAGSELLDIFQGAFFSPVPDSKTVPAGTFVYSLKGWKLGYHRLWARREGGFQPRELTRFASVEAMREIANWQVASLFLARFRGEGLTQELLRESGVSPAKLAEMGLDPYVFADGDPGARRLDSAYEDARRQLRRLRFPESLVRRLKEARGARVVVDLAARLEGADSREVERVRSEIERSLAADRRNAPKFDRERLTRALAHLAECYRTPGLETILAEDLEAVRDAVTVSSRVPVEWSEAQSLLSDMSEADLRPSARVPRPWDFNPGTVVRIRSLSDPSRIEFNEACAIGDAPLAGGLALAFPISFGLRAYDGLVDALERHPINVNRASRRVLRAVLTGVRGYAKDQVVTPEEAKRLAEVLLARVPIRGHEELRGILIEAAQSGAIDEEDCIPLLLNAISPTHPLLRASTTGFTYASADVYTIESTALVRALSGSQIARASFREIVEVSAPGPLRLGLWTQADCADGVTLFLGGDPSERNRGLMRVPFPGILSHHVQTRPLLLERVPFSFPGGDRSTFRLLPAESPREDRYAFGETFRFPDTYDGLELAHGEAWTLPMGLGEGGPAALPGAPGAAAARSGRGSLSTVPGGVEFWFRLRTYPEARDADGNLILFDASSGEPERNRISLVYSPAGLVRLRVWDASLPDPTIERTRDSGQYLEIAGRRPLELETWYHIRILWDGVFGGGAQLFADGLPIGTDNLSTELLSAIPATGDVAAIAVRDATRFPREGVVRIDSELFEYVRSGNSLRVRVAPPSHWVPVPERRAGPAREGAPVAAVEPARPLVMRSPWNGRGGAAGPHAPGARVILHGYSLPVRRKIVDPATGYESQIPEGDSRTIVWGRGGRRLREPLLAFNFPPSVLDLVHYIDFDVLRTPEPPGPGKVPAAEPPEIPAGGGNYAVPLFRVYRGAETGVPGGPGKPGPLGAFEYTAQLPDYPRDAADYFQSEGVVRVGERVCFYRREALPPVYLQAQAKDRRVDPAHPQKTGLLLLEPYLGPGQRAAVQAAGEAGAVPAAGAEAEAMRLRPGASLRQLSALADGAIEGYYPPSGVLEVRGSPTPWERALGRPDCSGQSLFLHHPDDAVEWLRYVDVQRNLFIGRTGRGSNFRGYPESGIREKKQLDLPAGSALRLVMELAEGGAGFGDYVSIVSSDPSIYEPEPRRVYKVLENVDGRFFVSLVPVSSTGVDLSVPDVYEHTYTRSVDPRLVKFPSWRLPQCASAQGVFFGDPDRPSSSARSYPGGVRRDEYEDPTGVTIDEVRRLYNPRLARADVRHLLVPLEGGGADLQRSGDLAWISGRIPAERAVTPANPLQALVVTVGGEGGRPVLFAEGEERGVLRVGDELFFFEGDGGDLHGRARLQVAEGEDIRIPISIEGRERDPVSRNAVFEEIPAVGFSGRFEPEGFARLSSDDPALRDFYEVFYYRRLSGGFAECLRGQFGTPIVLTSRSGTFENASRRVRLTGRALLGSKPASHGLGDPCSFVPYAKVRPLAGALTDAQISVEDAGTFSHRGGYLLVSSGFSGRPWEVIAHLGPAGGASLARPRDERGRGILRACFGTVPTVLGADAFAYEMPYRYPDRYEPEVESEHLAFLQKSFRVPGARWLGIEWLERPSRTVRERRADVVVAARFDGKPNWDAKPTNRPGGLFVFESDRRARERGFTSGELGVVADQLEIRVYFRYPSGSFTVLPDNIVTDDWKETPVIEYLNVVYEKPGGVVRHEELTF